jgi:hypothetical protein
MILIIILIIILLIIILIILILILLLIIIKNYIYIYYAYYITFPLTHPKNNAFHRHFAHPRSRQAFLQCPSYGSYPPRMSVSQAFCPERWAMSYRTPEAFLRTADGVGPQGGPCS